MKLKIGSSKQVKSRGNQQEGTAFIFISTQSFYYCYEIKFVKSAFGMRLGESHGRGRELSRGVRGKGV